MEPTSGQFNKPKKPANMQELLGRIKDVQQELKSKEQGTPKDREPAFLEYRALRKQYHSMKNKPSKKKGDA